MTDDFDSYPGVQKLNSIDARLTEVERLLREILDSNRQTNNSVIALREFAETLIDRASETIPAWIRAQREMAADQED